MSASAWIDVERKEGWRDRARPYKATSQGDVRSGRQLWMIFFDVIFKPTKYIRAELSA